MKKYPNPYLLYLALVFFLPVVSISAQSLTPSVISTSGGFYSNTSGMLSFTTGEMSAVETYTASNTILTQGFQQVWQLGTSTHDEQKFPVSISIYPNPSDGHFKMVTAYERNAKVNLQVIDLLGREVRHIDFDQESDRHEESIDLSAVSTGMYLLYIMVMDRYAAAPAFQDIEKIQIIK